MVRRGASSKPTCHVLPGDCLEILRDLPEDHFDSVVTDPPYDLIAGKKGGGGFMGREWDATGVAFDPATWEAVLRVLKPGAYLLAFGGTRTWHRLACAIEDAGFEIRDSIDWIYGSGFPKSLDVSKAIDKAGGNPLAFREFARAYADAVTASPLTHTDIDRHLGIKSSSCYWAREDYRGGMPPRHHWAKVCSLLGLDDSLERFYDEAERAVTQQGIGRHVPGDTISWDQRASGDRERRDIAATSAAARWNGWGTALKPAHEPIILARKPLTGTVAANVLEYGTGALNIGGCRVAHADDADLEISRSKNPGRADLATSGVYGRNRPQQSVNDAGRWPPNILLTHDPACTPAGVRAVRSDGHHPARRGPGGLSTAGHQGQDDLAERKSGTETVQAWDCVPGCPVAELDVQSGTSSSAAGGGIRNTALGMMNDDAWQPKPTMMPGYGDTGGASRFFPVFRYQAKAPKSERPRLEDGTAWPTVKPLELMCWLARFVTPPGGRVLDLFAGTGTTGQACLAEGFSSVLIERDPTALELIRVRIPEHQ